MARRTLAWTLVTSLALACSTSSSGGADGLSAGDGATTTSTGTAGDSDASGPDSDASADGGPKYDVGVDETTGYGTEGEQGCKKIDFLFVVDNSGSMGDNQQNLVNSFPDFIAAIQDTVMAQDYHILVTDTDVAVSEDLLNVNPGDMCEPHPDCCATICLSDDTCNGVPCGSLDDCNYVLGAGQINDMDGQACGIVAPDRYMFETQPDLPQTFACVAEVGTFGNGNEKQIQAMTDALAGPMNDPGGCNEAFLRDDAILVVTFISDEEDNGSTGTLASWKQAVVDAKNGDHNAIVMLGLVSDSDLPNGVCQAEMEAPQLRAFADSFAYGSWASVCEPNYAPFFAQAVTDIDTACDLFEPAG